MIVFSKKLNQDCLRLKLHLFFNINIRHLKNNWVDITFVYKLVLKIAIFCALRAVTFTAVV